MLREAKLFLIFLIGIPEQPVLRSEISLQRQEFNAVSQVFGVECLDDQFQVAYCLADRDTEGVSIEQSCEIAPRFEPFIGNAQQVSVLTEQDAVELPGSIQEQVVVEPVRPVFSCGYDINASSQEPSRNRCGNMMIDEQSNAQGKSPLALNLRRIGDAPRPARICATSRRPFSISRSSSSW